MHDLVDFPCNIKVAKFLHNIRISTNLTFFTMIYFLYNETKDASIKVNLKPLDTFGKQYCPKAHTACITTYMENNKPVKI